jgi:Dolichyl-phosphate-mannose-protein mannosyltransferase
MSLLAIFLSGTGLVAAGFPSRASGAVERAFRATVAVALGLGTWSAGQAAWLLAFGRPGSAKDILLTVAGAGLVLAFRQRPAEEPPARSSAPRWVTAIFVAGCGLAAAAFIEDTRRFPDGGWDAWMIWNLRARFLLRADDFRTAFSPEMGFLAHQDYPWLVPGVVSQAFAIVGESVLVPAVVAAVFAVLTVAAVALALARAQGPGWGLLGGLAVVTLPCFPVFAANQQSDVPMAAYLAISAALLASARSRRELALAGFSAGLGMWTKNEGALYAVCLGAALLWRTRDLRATLAFAAGVLPCAALLVSFKLHAAPPNDLVAFSTRATAVANLIDVNRWFQLLLLALRKLVYFQAFGLWMLVEGLLLALFLRKQQPSVLGTALFLACIGLGLIYVIQPHPLKWIFRTSADRILAQLWPAAILASVPPLAHRSLSRLPRD